jgi:hypothetical protein
MLRINAIGNHYDILPAEITEKLRGGVARNRCESDAGILIDQALQAANQ